MNQPVEYRNIPGWPGYRVGDDGSVWSRRDNHHGLREQWKPLKARNNLTKRYREVGLRSPGLKRKWIRVHVLVLLAFVGPRPEKHEGCHKNGDIENNTLSNLRWGTHAENIADRERHGKTARGARQGLAKLTDSKVTEILTRLQLGETTGHIAKDYEVDPSCIGRIASGEIWRHVPRLFADQPANRSDLAPLLGDVH